MKENPLVKLHSFGQSIWQDFIRRDMLAPGGTLQQLIDRDCIMGVTSNPAIFEKAIDESPAYDDSIRQMAKGGKSVQEIYETLTVEDVGRGADIFKGVYQKTERVDGYVSLEVSPKLAHDTQGTLVEARRLWGKLNRPNVLIKVPATKEGLPAIQTLIGEGINVNVTLLFGLPRYREVHEAYIAGVEKLHASGGDIGKIASVASFFLSRIDTLLDPKFEAMARAGGPKADVAKNLPGKVAIASAKLAYQIYKKEIAGDRWKRLAAKGAHPQRLLWASTSTKNPKYSDVMYVEALIGKDTVNTAPPETIDAYRDHGNPAARLEEGVPESERDLKQLAELGISIDGTTQQLEDEGVAKFITPYEKLLSALHTKMEAAK